MNVLRIESVAENLTRRRTLRSTPTDLMLALVAALTCIGIAQSVAADAQAPRVRMLPYSLQPIEDQLLPNDEVVVIKRVYDSGFFDRVPNAAEYISYSTERADAVALVDLMSVGGILVDGGTWVHTRMVGRVRQVIKSSARQKLSSGQRVELSVNGGELKIGNVLVKTEDALRLPIDRRYLLFMYDAGPTFGVDLTHRPLLVEHGRLVDPQPRDPSKPSDPLSGLTLSSVIEEIRRVPDRDSLR